MIELVCKQCRYYQKGCFFDYGDWPLTKKPCQALIELAKKKASAEEEESIEEQLKRRYKATVKMKKPWISEYLKKPTQDMILEALADEILAGEIDEIFEITIDPAKLPQHFKDCTIVVRNNNLGEPHG